MEENQTDQSMSESSTSGTDELGEELKPWIHDLFDIRVIMFLLSIGVIAMTVTVLLLSSEEESGEGGPSNQNNSARIDPLSETGAIEGSEATSAVELEPAEVVDLNVVDLNVESSEAVDAGKPEFSKLTVRQESDGSFNLPIRSAKVAGCEVRSSGISNWSNDSEARWDLGIQDRRTGYFRCYITYRSKYEGSLDICLGDRRPVTFYALPQDSDFTEQLMVRLDKPERPTLALIAKEIDPNSDLIITRIRMVPR
ncbi:hypothetical protein N9Z70_07550 [Mariniblastus sp.]|nr:hypothetical protein [Mariniblastus sp.]